MKKITVTKNNNNTKRALIKSKSAQRRLKRKQREPIQSSHFRSVKQKGRSKNVLHEREILIKPLQRHKRNIIDSVN